MVGNVALVREESYVQVTVTTDSREEADKLAHVAVDNRLAACAQILSPITSTYWWQGKVETAEEWMLLMKTQGRRVVELIDRLRAEHSYETPEIIVTPITAGNPAYLAWIETETADRAASPGSC